LTSIFITPAASYPSHQPILTKPLAAFEQQWGYQSPEPYYAEVMAEYQALGYQRTEDIQIDLAGSDYSQVDAVVEVRDQLDGNSGGILVWQEGDGTGFVEWTIDVPATGLYNFGIEYYPIPGKRASIQRDLQIDGKYPFIEARRLAFDRTWEDSHEVRQDNQGNDIRPSQIEAPVWRFQTFEDAQAMYRAPYLFYLEQGMHVIRLGVIREPIAIARLSVFSPPIVPLYREALVQYQTLGYQPPQNVMIVIEGEEAEHKSTPTLTRNYSPNPAAYECASRWIPAISPALC